MVMSSDSFKWCRYLIPNSGNKMFRMLVARNPCNVFRLCREKFISIHSAGSFSVHSAYLDIYLFQRRKEICPLFSYLFAITSPQLITDIHLYSPLSDPALVFTVCCVFHQTCYKKSFLDERFDSFSIENAIQIVSCPVMTQSSEVWTHPWLGC